MAGLPSAGPSAHDVLKATAHSEYLPYIVVELTPQVVSYVGPERGEGFQRIGESGPPPEVILGVGDVISVTIFEAAAGGLFIPGESGVRPGNFVTLPDQIVDNDGNITMPYAGTIKAAGRSIPDIQDEIIGLLRDRAIEPQVVISLVEQQATQVSVLGAVRQPSRFAINPSGDRLLDVIAKAGGPQFPNYETYVTLQRGNREATEHFQALVDNPAANIYVQAGDTVVLSHRPESFVALGASGRNDVIPFEQAHLSLAEAIGKAGGLLDERADPTFVFLYREEQREALESIGYSLPESAVSTVPTIYTVDVRDPGGYFLASKFSMRDKDVLYVANAPAVDINKVFLLVDSAVETARDIQRLGTD